MSPSAENPHAGQGAVLLDIGGDIGALIVTMPPSMEGVEVEIRPVGAGRFRDDPPGAVVHHDDDHDHDHGHGHGHHHHPHVEVVLRPTAEGPVPSLVFPELLAGSYELYVKDTSDVDLVVEVTGGEVATATWPH